MWFRDFDVRERVYVCMRGLNVRRDVRVKDPCLIVPSGAGFDVRVCDVNLHRDVRVQDL